MNNNRITKQLMILAVAILGLLSVPVANADVVVRYVVVEDGHSYREPFGYQRGSRLYSNTSRLGGITYSNGSRYRERCEDDRYYNEPRQYRNNYYYGRQDRHRNSRDFQHYNNQRGGSVYHRDNRRKNNDHRRNAPDAYHGYYRTPAYPDKRMHSDQGGRVHINIK